MSGSKLHINSFSLWLPRSSNKAQREKETVIAMQFLVQFCSFSLAETPGIFKTFIISSFICQLRPMYGTIYLKLMFSYIIIWEQCFCIIAFPNFKDLGRYIFSEQIIGKRTAIGLLLLFTMWYIDFYYYLWSYLFLSMFFLWRPGRVLCEVLWICSYSTTIHWSSS